MYVTEYSIVDDILSPFLAYSQRSWKNACVLASSRNKARIAEEFSLNLILTIVTKMNRHVPGVVKMGQK
jgi:hypothetical protein